mmetsp:Transcript_7076/g.13147  ORF Transcript_7076/g.13147 Transcript_7076/m.13147 type:complete len:95 (-) Transcript_7076:9-293(-)
MKIMAMTSTCEAARDLPREPRRLHDEDPKHASNDTHCCPSAQSLCQTPWVSSPNISKRPLAPCIFKFPVAAVAAMHADYLLPSSSNIRFDAFSA